MRKLNVKKTTLNQIRNLWGVQAMPNKWQNVSLYVRCDKLGVINWEKALIYTSDELITRGNVNIIL